jgi:hypothetical protein
MRRAALSGNRQFLACSPGLCDELRMPLKKRGFLRAHGARLEQDQVGLRGRQYLLAWIWSFAACRQHEEQGKERAAYGGERPITTCGHHVGEEQNTERRRAFARPEMTTPAFVGMKRASRKNELCSDQ